MLIGSWSSDAFLLHIRRQVQEFLDGVSGDIISQENFYTIPDLEEVDPLDPRARNPKSFENTISIKGPRAASTHTKRPEFHVWR